MKYIKHLKRKFVHRVSRLNSFEVKNVKDYLSPDMLLIIVLVLIIVGVGADAYRGGLSSHKKISVSTDITKSQPSTVTTSPPQIGITKPTTVTKTITTKSSPIPKSSTPVVPSPSSSVSSLKPIPAPVTPPSPSSNTGGTSSTTSPTPITPSYTSTNWSGYMATTGTFSQVSGSWTVPTVTGNGSTVSADATWVGIGGVTSGDLIQVGIEDTVEPNGHVIAGGFYEMLPAASQAVPGMTVSPGDSITASVSEVSLGHWTINIKDNTTGQSYKDNVAYNSSQSSAEWIEEDPSYTRGNLVPLDNFGTVDFTNGATIDNNISVDLATSNAASIDLVNASNQTIATTSAIGSDGSSFSVTHN